MYKYPLFQGTAKIDEKKTYNLIGKIPNFYTEKVIGSVYNNKLEKIGTFSLAAGKDAAVSGSV